MGGVFIGSNAMSTTAVAAIARSHPGPVKAAKVQETGESEILARAAQGDGEAFGALYERYVGRIYNYIYYRTGDIFEAEDLTERVFLRALRHIPNYRDRGLPFSAWLYRIAHNLVVNWHRDNSRRKEIPLDDGFLGPLHSDHVSDHPEVELLVSEEQDVLMQAIRKLPPDRQQLLILKFVDHLSNVEIGQIMRRSEGAVKSLYHRTLLSIREELGGQKLAGELFEEDGGSEEDVTDRDG